MVSNVSKTTDGLILRRRRTPHLPFVSTTYICGIIMVTVVICGTSGRNLDPCLNNC